MVSDQWVAFLAEVVLQVVAAAAVEGLLFHTANLALPIHAFSALALRLAMVSNATVNLAMQVRAVSRLTVYF